MRILIIVPDLVMGGVTTVVKSLVNEIDKSRYEILIISLKYTSIKELYGFQVENLNIDNKVNYLLSIRKMGLIVKKFKPVIIHSHTIYPHLLIRFIKLLNIYNFLHVCSEHGTIYDYKGLIWNLFKLTNRYSEVVTFVSQYSANSYVERGLVSNNQARVLFNGIKFDSLSHTNIYKKSDVFHLAYIGRFSEEKNVLNLLKAIKLLKNKINNFELSIIGEGSEENNLKKYVRDNDLSLNINFLGYKDNIKEILKEIDLLVLSSNTEGLPMAILEAMAMQCNVVSTRCGGIPEIFEGIPNFLANINDSEDLASKILNNLTLSKEDREQIGLLYKQRVFENFSINKYVSNLEKIYHSLLD